MVSAVGLGLAMRNATPDLQSAAAAVTVADNNHAGLLRAIEALFSLWPIIKALKSLNFFKDFRAFFVISCQYAGHPLPS